MPGKGSSLTGGTGDVNPQWYKLVTTDPATYGTFAPPAVLTTGVKSQAFPIPISKLRVQGQKATVIELLKVRWQVSIVSNAGIPAAGHYAGGQVNVEAFLTTKAYTNGVLPGPSDGPIIDQASFHTEDVPAIYFLDSTAPPLYFGGITPPYHFENPLDFTNDLTDGDGHGVIIATDNVYLTFNSIGAGFQIPGTGSAGSFTVDDFTFGPVSVFCWLLYRFKDVALTEYIGVVQSQQ